MEERFIPEIHKVSPGSPWSPGQNVWSGLLPRLVSSDRQMAATGFGSNMLAPWIEPIVPPFMPSLKVLTYGGHVVLTPDLCYPPATSTSLHHFWSVQEILGFQNALQTIYLLHSSEGMHNHHMACWKYLKAEDWFHLVFPGMHGQPDGLRPLIHMWIYPKSTPYFQIWAENKNLIPDTLTLLSVLALPFFPTNYQDCKQQSRSLFFFFLRTTWKWKWNSESSFIGLSCYASWGD